MPAYSSNNDTDERRGSPPTRHHSDDRFAEEQQEKTTNSGRRNRSNSLRSRHYLPEHYSLTEGNESSRRSQGAPPPPPPPPYARGRNDSFYSMPGNAAGPRGRSSSISRGESSGSQQSRSRHGEGKDGDTASDDELARSRLISTARSYSKSPSTSDLPLIDANGKRRSRSRSRSKSRGRERRQQSLQPPPSSPRGANSSPQEKSARATKKESKPRQGRRTKSPASQRRAQSPTTTGEVTQKSFKEVIAENSASTHRSSRRSNSRGRSNSRSRGRSTSRSRTRNNPVVKVDTSRMNSDTTTTSKRAAAEPSSSAPSRKFMVEIGEHGQCLQVFEFSSDGASLPKKEPAFIEHIRRNYSEPSRGRSTSRSKGFVARKIVVESDEMDNIIQVIELSGDGAILPAASDDDDDNDDVSVNRDKSPFSKRGARENDRHEKQKVRSKRETKESQHRPSAPDKSMYRQMSSRSSSSRPATPFSGRETYDENDQRENRHIPFCNRRRLSRSESPFSKRTDEFVGRKASTRSSSSPRSASLSRTTAAGGAGATLCPSLRSSLRDSGLRSSSVSRGASVRFALDNTDDASNSKAPAFDTSAESFGSSSEPNCRGASDNRSSSKATTTLNARGRSSSKAAVASFNTSEGSFGSSLGSISRGANGTRSSSKAATASKAIDRPSSKAAITPLSTSEDIFKSTGSSAARFTKSVSFIMDQQPDGDLPPSRDAMSALTSSLSSYNRNQNPPYPLPPPAKPSALDTRNDSLDTSVRSFEESSSTSRRSDSLASRQDVSLTSSMPSDYKSAYQYGEPIIETRDRHNLYPQPPFRGLSNVSEKSDESSANSRRQPERGPAGDQDVLNLKLPHRGKPKSFIDISERSNGSNDVRPPPPRGKSKSFIDTSERSNDSNGVRPPPPRGKSKSFIEISEMRNDSNGVRPLPPRGKSKSFIDNSERRNDFNNVRQPVSSVTEKSALDASERSDGSNSTHRLVRAPSQIHAYQPPDLRGRSSADRSLSRGRGTCGGTGIDAGNYQSCLATNDSSSLTARRDGRPISPLRLQRGRSAQSGDQVRHPEGPPSQQVQSLSRTRNDLAISSMGLRNVDFDPAPSIASSYQGNYHETKLQLKPPSSPFEKRPVQKSMLSHSTEETFISAISDTEDTYFTNQTTRAVQEEMLPFMNSTLTIFESDCSDEEQSLLSDPTFFKELVPPGVALKEFQESIMAPITQLHHTNGDLVYTTKKDTNNTRSREQIEEVSKQERRSRIRSMLSRNASTKRRNGIAPVAGSSSKPSLDTSGETFVSMDESSLEGWMMDGAQESLLNQQSHVVRGQQQRQRHEYQGFGNGSRHKSRLARLLKR